MPQVDTPGNPGGWSDHARAVAHHVSVVIPAYNCAHTVAATIESCLAQDYDDLEIIVVNDGSTDQTSTVLAAFGARITVVNQPNGGLAAARNTGQRMATGQYVVWMDADDLMIRDRIRLQAAVLDANPECGLVSSDFSAFVDGDTDTESSHMANYYHAVGRLGGVTEAYPQALAAVVSDRRTCAVRSGDIYEALLWGNFVHPPTVMVRRSLLDEVGFGDESLRYSSDYDLILRLAAQTRFAFVDAPLLRYRRSGEQMSHLHAGDRMQLETVRILERIRRDDPEVYDRHRAVFRLRIAESLVLAADSLATVDRGRALGLLLRGAREKLLFAPTAFALGRIMTTPSFLQAVKHALRAAGIRWAIAAWACFGSDIWDVMMLGSDLF